MKIRNLESNLGLFIVVSVVLHAAAAAALYYLASESRPPERERAYIVRIVPPEPVPPEPTAPGALKGRPGPAPKALAKKPTPPRPEPRPEEEAKVARAPEARPPSTPPSETPARGEPEAGAQGKTAPPLEEAPESAVQGKGPLPPASPGKPGGKGTAEGQKGEKERLFDPDVLAGVAKKGLPPRPPDSGITFDAEELRQYSYMRKLKARIESVWEYPREAAKKGIYGDLVIKFVIKKDGSLGSVELVRTSGWQSLDQAALAALEDGAPYWPLPEEWQMDALTVTGHFIYSLSGYYYVR